MEVNKTSTISSYDVVKAYQEKYGGKWNDCCDDVGDYEYCNRTYYLDDDYDLDEDGEPTLIQSWMNEIMRENDIDEIYVTK